MLEGNLVVVEPLLETILCHASVDSCITGCVACEQAPPEV